MLEGYPPALLALLADLDADAFRPQERASCSRCAMHPPAGVDPAGERTFVDERCCTYHPALPNFLVGLALNRGGRGEALMQQRLAAGDGVYDLGLTGPWAFQQSYDATSESRFGRDPSLRCPFFVGGDHACGIHRSRGAVCRTWHCRYDHGVAGFIAWTALRRLLDQLELELARRCARAVGRPWPWSRAATWETFFRECSEVLERVVSEEGDAVSRGVVGEWVTLTTAVAERDAPMPERLRAAGHRVEPSVRGRWVIVGYSAWDPVEAPPQVLDLLRALGSGGAWREAVTRVSQDSGVPVDAALVERLWRAGVLVPADQARALQSPVLEALRDDR